jgi:glycosyltransferase involved in cell wall biosynthesis
MKGWHWYEYTYMLSVLWFLLRNMRAFDVVQCFGLYLFIPPVVLVSYLLGKMAVGRVEGSGAYGDFHRIRQLRCGGLILASARRLDRVISIAQHVGCEINNEGFSDRAIVAIPNSVDQEFYRPENNRGQSGRKRICFVGRLAEEKGIDCLIKAMKKVNAADPGVELDIVGDGPMRERLQNLSDSLHLQDLIHFIGNCAALPYYRGSDIFVLPSLSEGLSLSLLEAMACGLPVIASNVEGNREVLDPHEADTVIPPGHYLVAEYGIMVNPGDIDGLSSAIVRLVNDDALSHQLHSSARRHVENNYALDKIADEYQSLYASLGGRQSR